MALLHSLELLSLSLIWSVMVNRTALAHQLAQFSSDADPSAVTANTSGVTEAFSALPGE